MGEDSNCLQVVAEERRTGPVCKVDQAVEEERTVDPECKAEDSAGEAAYKAEQADPAEQAERADPAGAHRADCFQDRKEQGCTEHTWAEGSSTSASGSTEEGARADATILVVQSWAGKAGSYRGTSGRWDPRRRKKRTDRM